MTQLKLTPTEPTEAVVLAAVLRYLQCHPKVAWVARMNTGAGMFAHGKAAPSRFTRFGFKGSPDIHGMLKGGRALYVEVKRPSKRNNVSPEQASFLERASKHGGLAFIACSIDDVREVLDA